MSPLPIHIQCMQLAATTHCTTHRKLRAPLLPANSKLGLELSALTYFPNLKYSNGHGKVSFSFPLSLKLMVNKRWMGRVHECTLRRRWSNTLEKNSHTMQTECKCNTNQMEVQCKLNEMQPAFNENRMGTYPLPILAFSYSGVRRSHNDTPLYHLKVKQAYNQFMTYLPLQIMSSIPAVFPILPHPYYSHWQIMPA